MALFSPSEYIRRISTLQKTLTEKNIQAAVFTQSADIFYYSGSVIPLYCIVPAEGKAVTLARKGSSRIKEEAAHTETVIFSSSKDLASAWERMGLHSAVRLGFTLDTSSYAGVSRMMQLSPAAAPVDISWDSRLLRTVKSFEEITLQRKAGKIIAQIPAVVQKEFTPGMTELELSAHIEHYLRLNNAGIMNSKQEGLVIASGVCSSGAESLSPNKFDGICSGSGVSAALPFGASSKVIMKGETIICDYGFVLDGYHVDMTRMFAHGDAPAEAIKAHQAMIAIEHELMKSMKPGASWESLWQRAESMAKDSGYADEFMGLGPEKVRFVGHGVGVYLDEPPYLAPKMNYELKKDMIIAIEPKVSLPGIGVVGIENTVIVNDNGAEIITDCGEDFYIL